MMDRGCSEFSLCAYLFSSCHAATLSRFNLIGILHLQIYIVLPKMKFCFMACYVK